MEYLLGEGITKKLSLSISLIALPFFVEASPFVKSSEEAHDYYDSIPATEEVDFIEYSNKLLKDVEQETHAIFRGDPKSADTIDKESNLDPEDHRYNGQVLMGTFDDTKEIKSYNKKYIYDTVHNASKASYSLTYMQDEYDIVDPNNIFNKTYVQGTDSYRHGTITISTERYLQKSSFVNTAWGMSLGMGFNRGKGQFSSGNRSDMEFRLFTFPVDLTLSTEFLISSLMKINLSLGPSLMGLHQTRTDMDYSESQRYRRQIGSGYFYSIKLKTSLSKLFSSSGFKALSQSKVSNMFLDISMRQHRYRNFKDNITISGPSYGIGFSFEKL